MARAKVVSESLLEEMRRAEERGREWAYHREWPVERYSLTSEVLWPMESTLARLLEKRVEIEALVPDKGDEFEEFVKRLKSVAAGVGYLMYSEWSDLYDCVRGGVSLGECDRVDPAVKEKLREVDKLAEKLFGRRCTWLLGVKEPYTVSALLNDLTACYHRVIDFIEKEGLAGAEVEVFEEGKCRWYKGSDERLVEACRAWDEMTRQLNELELYSYDDYRRLEGVVYNRKAEFTVGSSPGHKTHIDLDKRELMYYDDDRDVNENVKQLLEHHADVECEVVEEGGKSVGVRCTWSKEWEHYYRSLERVMEVLAFATSMDFRMSEPLYYWPKALSEYITREEERREDRMFVVMRTFLENCGDKQELEKELAELFL